MNPYPNLNNNTPDYRNSNALNNYVDPNTYSSGPTPTGNVNYGMNQGYPQNRNPPPVPNYNAPYAPPRNYNDPNIEHYEVYNNGYSGRQRSTMIAIVVIVTMLLTGLILFLSRRSQNRYPTYY